MGSSAVECGRLHDRTVPLGRPRHQSMLMSSEFLALRRGLMSLIREESLKAIGGEVNDIALQGLDISTCTGSVSRT